MKREKNRWAIKSGNGHKSRKIRPKRWGRGDYGGKDL